MQGGPKQLVSRHQETHLIRDNLSRLIWVTRSDGVYSITSGCPVLASQSQNRHYTPKQNRETRVLEGSRAKGSPHIETKRYKSLILFQDQDVGR